MSGDVWAAIGVVALWVVQAVFYLFVFCAAWRFLQLNGWPL